MEGVDSEQLSLAKTCTSVYGIRKDLEQLMNDFNLLSKDFCEVKGCFLSISASCEAMTQILHELLQEVKKGILTIK